MEVELVSFQRSYGTQKDATADCSDQGRRKATSQWQGPWALCRCWTWSDLLPSVSGSMLEGKKLGGGGKRRAPDVSILTNTTACRSRENNGVGKEKKKRGGGGSLFISLLSPATATSLASESACRCSSWDPSVSHLAPLHVMIYIVSSYSNDMFRMSVETRGREPFSKEIERCH